MFINTSAAITKNDIDEIEKKLNVVLPKKLVLHYMKYNGGISEKKFCIQEFLI